MMAGMVNRPTTEPQLCTNCGEPLPNTFFVLQFHEEMRSDQFDVIPGIVVRLCVLCYDDLRVVMP